MVQSMSLGWRLFAALRASRLDRTICGDNGQAGYAATIGIDAGIDPEDLVHARFILIWGSNTVVTNLHLWPFVLEARRSGARVVVVVDPVRTRTARAADLHVAPLPGTDAALALGMMNVIVREGLTDEEYVERYTVGYERLVERAAEYPPERAASITGVPAEQIVSLAREYATTRPAAIRTLIGMDHRRNGAITFRAIACLPALVGAWRDRGGGLTGMTGRHVRNALPMHRLWMPELEDPATRLISMIELGRALTDAGLDPPVRALYVYNSNPAAIAPNQGLVLAGLAREDLFTVVHEQFMTDTARHADYVLPATTQLEHLDLMYTWGHLYLTLNLPAISPPGEALPNNEVFRRLARALGLGRPELQESDEEIVRSVLDSEHPFVKGITYEPSPRTGGPSCASPRTGGPSPRAASPRRRAGASSTQSRCSPWDSTPCRTSSPHPRAPGETRTWRAATLSRSSRASRRSTS